MNKHPIILEAYRIINEALETTTADCNPTELDEDALFEALKLVQVEHEGKRHTVWGMPVVETEDLSATVLRSPDMIYDFREPRMVHIVSLS